MSKETRVEKVWVDEIARRIDELASAWIELVGNTSNKDAFGNVTIDEVDYNFFHEMISALAHKTHRGIIAKEEDSMVMKVPIVLDTYPVVLYLGSEMDREDLIQSVRRIIPDMQSRKLPSAKA